MIKELEVAVREEEDVTTEDALVEVEGKGKVLKLLVLEQEETLK